MERRKARHKAAEENPSYLALVGRPRSSLLYHFCFPFNYFFSSWNSAEMTRILTHLYLNGNTIIGGQHK